MKKLATIAALVLFLSGTLSSMNDNTADKSKPSAKANTEERGALLIGNVVDGNTDESLVGVSVEIVGTGIQLYTDFDGNFELNNIEPGIYNIIVRYVSYQGHLLEQVYLKPGQNKLPQVKLNPAQ
jgi:hypothetical protein